MVISGRSWFTPGIPGIYVVLLCDVLKELGHDPAPLLRALDLRRDQLLAPECRLPMDRANLAAEAGLALVGGAGLGFRYAKAMRITLHGPLGLLALSSPTLDDGLDAARRYLGLRAPFLNVERELLGDHRQALCFRTDFGPGPVRSFVIESMVIGFVYMLEQLMEACPDGAEVHFQGRPPAHAEALRRAVPVPVHYGQPRDALILSADLLAARPRLADPQAEALAREQCELEFRRWRADQEGPLPERIRAALRDQDAPLPDLAEMAERLAVSPRTLKRHLQQAGLTYRQLQDEARYHQAKKLLTDRALRVSEVAYALGYNDVANFSRAFKRWSGKTPKGYRQGETRNEP
ncbi:AraC family transcriptional regulator [Alloalcanivorax mobilis]|uniref:AraC family transcriptional regulator n=1 Tax=Alloalcanivorax mobilis TaxID=2019569 RepID=UPI000B5B347A|nr:AraC family transcriptional regulator [Alloalcanivorax mobilis]ASK33057.1 AraC family transcriptional regulator [Alcanivorax sp. N3-2A]ASK36875.1 AraC family transcriptional regulator [Alcanivorax sp. N3-2A]